MRGRTDAAEERPLTGRVLLVEDEPNITIALSYLFERAGFDIEAVADGDAAIDALRIRPPNVLVLDVMLPKRNGFEVLKFARGPLGLATMPVLVLTARGRSQDRKIAEEFGADAFLTKPFANKDVVEVVQRLTAASRAAP